jgi:hypothetical protein
MSATWLAVKLVHWILCQHDISMQEFDNAPHTCVDCVAQYDDRLISGGAGVTFCMEFGELVSFYCYSHCLRSTRWLDIWENCRSLRTLLRHNKLKCSKHHLESLGFLFHHIPEWLPPVS